VKLYSFRAASHGAKYMDLSNIYVSGTRAAVTQAAVIVEMQMNSLKLRSFKLHKLHKLLSMYFWPPVGRPAKVLMILNWWYFVSIDNVVIDTFQKKY